MKGRSACLVLERNSTCRASPVDALTAKRFSWFQLCARRRVRTVGSASRTECARVRRVSTVTHVNQVSTTVQHSTGVHFNWSVRFDNRDNTRLFQRVRRVSASCFPPCQHGGSCSGPDRCTCPAGWTSKLCERGEHQLTETSCPYEETIARFPGRCLVLQLCVSPSAAPGVCVCAQGCAPVPTERFLRSARVRFTLQSLCRL